MIDYGLYLVTDDPSRYAGNWMETVVAAVEGGVTCVQYRDTESDDGERFARARRLHDALRRRGIPLVVNNDARLAAAIAAEGVHVGQLDMPPEEVRSIVGAECEIGLSITDPEQMRRVPRCVACVGAGPVFDARRTKADAAAAIGISGLSAVVSQAEALTVVAIGGITLDNAASVVAAGADGLAVVSAFSKAEDPYEVAKEFSVLLNGRRQ